VKNNHVPIIEEFISSVQIKDKINKLGERITNDHKTQGITALVVLKGAACFASDLLRTIDLDVRVEFIHLSSYTDDASTELEMKSISSEDFDGERVIIVEDIVDTGKTVAYISDYLDALTPKSIQICCLLNKESRREVPVNLDYIGFNIEDRFVIGYGMDFNNRFRNLPFVGIMS